MPTETVTMVAKIVGKIMSAEFWLPAFSRKPITVLGKSCIEVALTTTSIIMEKCTSLSGTWTDVETYNLGSMTGYEGPAIYKLNGEDKWCLLLDYYSKSKGYKPFVTEDITKGVFTQAADFTFDGTYRHGTVLPITQDEYNALIEKY